MYTVIARIIPKSGAVNAVKIGTFVAKETAIEEAKAFALYEYGVSITDKNAIVEGDRFETFNKRAAITFAIN